MLPLHGKILDRCSVGMCMSMRGSSLTWCVSSGVGCSQAGLPQQHAVGRRGSVAGGLIRRWAAGGWAVTRVAPRAIGRIRCWRAAGGLCRSLAPCRQRLDAWLQGVECLGQGGHRGLYCERGVCPVVLGKRQRPLGRTVGGSRCGAHGAVTSRRRVTCSRAYRSPIIASSAHNVARA